MINKSELKEILALGNYILHQKGPSAFMGSEVAKRLGDFISDINSKFSRELTVTSFIHHEDPETRDTIIDSVSMFMFGHIFIEYADWTIVQSPEESIQVYRVYIEDVPELACILPYLDGEEKHPLWFRRDPYSNNTVTQYSSFDTHFHKYLNELSKADFLKFVKCSTINPAHYLGK